MERECKPGAFTNPNNEIGLGYHAGLQERRPTPEQYEAAQAAHDYCTADCIATSTEFSWACGALNIGGVSTAACIPTAP